MTAQASPIPSAYELRMKQANVIRKFFNKMQRQAMAIAAHDEYIVASRGTGKSEGIDARFILRNVWEMPGSLGGMISPSYAKAWGNTLPGYVKITLKFPDHPHGVFGQRFTFVILKFFIQVANELDMWGLHLFLFVENPTSHG